jgi:hypothetical protein
MGLFSKIWNLLKTGVSKLIGLFKNKSPGQLIEDASKAAVGVATVVAVGYATVNVARSIFMRGKGRRSEKRRPRAGVDFFHEDREAGSMDEKIENAKSRYRRYDGLTQEDLDLLEEVSKTRNQIFRLMNPAEQMNLLRIEGFNFDEFREHMERQRDRRKIRKSKRRVGEASPEEQSFREPVDYGWFNWLMRPLDDFLCWLKDDPTPKKCPQIHVVDREIIPNISVNSPEEAVASIRSLGPYLDSLNPNAGDYSFASMADAKEIAICADEIFRHKNLKSYRKAVRTRMLQDSNGLSSQIFDLMEDDLKSDKKKKKHRYDDDDDDQDSAYFKKKDKKHEEKARSSEADDEASRIYNHFLKAAMAGNESTKSYRLDHLFD